MKFTVEIAETVIEIESFFDDVYNLCKDYVSLKEPSFTVVISRQDIENERNKSDETNKAEGKDYRFTDGYLETLAVYRKICDYFADKGVILFHSSAIEADGFAYLFTAPSGTGKSTHARLWRNYLGERAQMINDDKPLIRVSDGMISVYGTPWDGKHRLSRNVCVPVKAICLLERGENNIIEEIEGGSAIPVLYAQTYKPEKAESLAKVLNSVLKLSAGVKCFRLKCNMDAEAAKVAYGAMSGKADIHED